MHDIDLSCYDIRTDLIDEVIEPEKLTIEKKEHIDISRIYLKSEDATKIGKKEGNYITISFEDITDFNNMESVKEVFSNELKEIMKLNNIKENDKALIIGLGNSKSPEFDSCHISKY